MTTNIQSYISEMGNMNYDEKLEYAFKKFYEFYNNDPYLVDCFFLIIAHLISKYNLSLDIEKLKDISTDDKRLIIDCAYGYIYEKENSLRGPILNLFGEILDSEIPYVGPYIELMKMLSYNKFMKK